MSKKIYFEEYQRKAVSQMTLGCACSGTFSAQSLSKQSFKHNSAHMPSLNITPPFEPWFHMFIITDDTHSN